MKKMTKKQHFRPPELRDPLVMEFLTDEMRVAETLSSKAKSRRDGEDASLEPKNNDLPL